VSARGFFVTGTDTGVGKTLVSTALLSLYGEQGLRVVGMKPVAAGCAPGELNEDVAALRAASTVQAPPELINPYAFEPAIAPHIAARQTGTRIDLDCIADSYAALARDADVVIVEGAGGFLVPLNESETLADLAQRLRLPVILVVGLRLGCLNHALLTAEAIRARGLKLAGWVANHIDPHMNCSAGNVEALVQRLDAPLLGEIPPLMPTENPMSTKRFIKSERL
jgi:dethiobiotin synthetase